MTQLTIFTPGHGNREERTLQVRLLVRRGDPETSLAAATRTAARLPESQRAALAIIDTYGPGTLRQIAGRRATAAMTTTDQRDVGSLYHELARRAPELAREGWIDYQRDARGRAVRVDGARVWEVTP